MSERRIIWILLKKNIKFWICLALIIVIVMLAIIGPSLTPYKPSDIIIEEYIVDKDQVNQLRYEIASKYNVDALKDTMVDEFIRYSMYISRNEVNTTISRLEKQGYKVYGVYETADPEIVRIGYTIPDKSLIKIYMRSQPPSSKHPFGTDKLCNDVFSATVYGLRVSLSVGVIAAIVATLVGTLLGLLAGYLGGWVDSVVDGATNLLLAIPTVFIMLMIGLFYVMGSREGGPQTIMGQELRNILFLGVAIGLLSWHWTARAVRAQVSALKASDFVAISRLSGNSAIKIIGKEVLPNIASYILLVFVIQLANALGTVVTLEFLGIKAAEWSLFAKINQYLQMGELWGGGWWSLFIPGTIIVIMITSLYIIVLALEEIFNPRLRKA